MRVIAKARPKSCQCGSPVLRCPCPEGEGPARMTPEGVSESHREDSAEASSARNMRSRTCARGASQWFRRSLATTEVQGCTSWARCRERRRGSEKVIAERRSRSLANHGKLDLPRVRRLARASVVWRDVRGHEGSAKGDGERWVSSVVSAMQPACSFGLSAAMPARLRPGVLESS